MKKKKESKGKQKKIAALAPRTEEKTTLDYSVVK